MFDLALISGVPGVKSAVLGDLAGGYLDAVREADGEGVAAVMGLPLQHDGPGGRPAGVGRAAQDSRSPARRRPASSPSRELP